MLRTTLIVLVLATVLPATQSLAQSGETSWPDSRGIPLTTAPGAANVGSDTGALTVPWEEFKRLLDLDHDDIVLSLEVFHRILAQTSAAPPAYTVSGGHVTLTREEFRQLIAQMKLQEGPVVPPPFSYLMTKAVYDGVLENDQTTFTATFHIRVLASGSYVEIPILPQSVALQQVEEDGAPALIVRKDGTHKVILSSPGEHVVTATFALRSKDRFGPGKIDLAILETPITLLELDLPAGNLEVEVPQAQQLAIYDSESTSGADSTAGTHVSAVCAPGSLISVRWRTEVAAVDKIPPKIYSEVSQVISIEDDVVQLNANVKLDILHSEIDRIGFVLPPGMNILAINGDGIGEWSESPGPDGLQIDVPFTYGRKGHLTLGVIAQRPLAEELSTSITGLRIPDAARETGYLGLEVRTSAEVAVLDHIGLEQIGVPKLPAVLHTYSTNPLMHGFKYQTHPYELTLSIRKHQKVEVPVAVINSANAVTLFTTDGKMVNRILYNVRNSAKQFLEVDIPEGADIWTIFVDRQPVESAIDDEGKLLVPLIRSRKVGATLADFPVEIVYCVVGDRFAPLASRYTDLPSVDVLTSQLMWSVYLPNDFAYHRFDSTLEKEEMIRTVNLFAGAKRQYNKDAMKSLAKTRAGGMQGAEEPVPPSAPAELREAYDGDDHASRFRNLPLADEELSSQMNAEIEFGSRLEGLSQDPRGDAPGTGSATGVLPIQIQVPTGGQVYRFAKTIIHPYDELSMTVQYSASWVTQVIRWTGVILGLGILYWRRRTLWSWILRSSTRLTAATVRVTTLLRQSTPALWHALRQGSRSIMTTVVLLGLLGPAFFAGPPAAGFVLFCLWISVIYQVVLFSRRRSEAKAMARTSTAAADAS